MSQPRLESCEMSIEFIEHSVEQAERLPLNVALSLDIVRAAGGEVCAETIALVCRVERGEITSDEAARQISDRYRREASESP